jgi:hypothetical protein
MFTAFRPEVDCQLVSVLALRDVFLEYVGTLRDWRFVLGV